MMLDGRYYEVLWRLYLQDKALVAPDWRNAFDFILTVYGDPFADQPLNGRSANGELPGYLRRFGHLHAQLDPLGLTEGAPFPADLKAQNDDERDLMVAYGGSLSVETGHIDDPAMHDWVVSRFEQAQREPVASEIALLERLIETEMFDRFMATKYVGKKRFGSEGADAILPLLHLLRTQAIEAGVDEMVIGSMHRGRLSILLNFAQMAPERLLSMFGGVHPFPDRTDLPADVAYHFGHHSEQDGFRMTLLPNPSHLEAVNPVVAGFTRARRAEGSGRAMGVILHTDASVIGQGVNAELLQMSALPGFSVGGIVHVVINNQVGFTTAPEEARSSHYCTGPWRAVNSLLLHVNGDDIDAVARAVTLAMEYRAKFDRDVVIDLVCYRANGHNEIDEPRFTQPVYYLSAGAKRSVVASYEERLIAEGLLTADDAAARRAVVTARLEAAYGAGPPEDMAVEPERRNSFGGDPLDNAGLRTIVEALAYVPEGEGNLKMIGIMNRRLDEIENGIGWPLAEAMAFGACLRAGIPVRVCGQDIERGPFSQRHLAAVHPQTGQRMHPMAALARHGATLEVVNSPLSEYAVMGFEYGYSLGSRGGLCVWEAQFGDFANGAQIMIDQFIASGFEKWRQTSNFVALLPHGLEGQGPEHSSARIERLLQLCARDNLRVAHPSTPANYFHLLYRQALEGEKPLFILTPKVLLRHGQARSPLAKFTAAGSFEPVLASVPEGGATRAVLCSGKIAYELEKLRGEKDAPVTIVRLESLYPFPAEALVLKLVAADVKEMLWLQEEPENFGANLWLRPRLEEVAQAANIDLLPTVARHESASPAGSFHGAHLSDQEKLLMRALGLDQVKG